METRSNTLSTLNDALFDTLSKLQSDKIDIKKANAITAVSSQIINSAKVQLAAFKLTKGATLIPTLTDNKCSVTKSKITQGDNYDKRRTYAIEVLKYKSLAEAISDLGAFEFKKQFNQYINN